VEAEAAANPGVAAGKTDERLAEATYEAIAPVYDDFTAHHDYEGWIGDLLPVLERHGLRGRRLLDVGCGTGKSFMPMLSRGWRVTGCDISASMLELAREKADGGAALSVADMRELPLFGEFDLVWALDDAINYLLDAEELAQALSGMRSNLAPTGLLLFDVNTLLAYRTFFAETELVERGGRRLLWQGQAASDMPPGSICEAHLSVDDAGEPLATHRQRHFPEAEVLEAIDDTGLQCLDVFGITYDGIPRRPLDEAVHTKAIYIARGAG
jgi:SAM-dependent methyltransferase